MSAQPEFVVVELRVDAGKGTSGAAEWVTAIDKAGRAADAAVVSVNKVQAAITSQGTAMTQAAKKAGAKVLLLGMQLPPNYGGAYRDTFARLFDQVAKAEQVALVPFLLKGVADVEDSASRFQADRIHPNEQSQTQMLANVWPELKKLIK